MAQLSKSTDTAATGNTLHPTTAAPLTDTTTPSSSTAATALSAALSALSANVHRLSPSIASITPTAATATVSFHSATAHRLSPSAAFINRPSLVSSSISSSTAATTSSPSSSTIPPPTTKTSLPAITTFLATLSFLVPLQSWVKPFAPSPTTSTSTTDSYAAAISSSPPGSSDPSSSTGSYLSMMIVYPTEQVKTLSQLLNKDGKPVFNGPVDVIRKTLKEKGVRGLYSGLPILLIGNFPVTGCRFGTFEGLKGMVSGDNNKLTFIQSLLCGLGAGVSEAIFAVTPIETLKVKYLEDRRLAKPVYRNFVHAATSIARSQGISGLYKGVSATVMKQGSNQMVRFSVLESLKNLYTNGNESKDIPTPIIGVFGVIAGAASVYANTPVDVVKTRLQGANAAVYSSTTDCIKQIIKNEGPKAFYKGTVPRLTRVCIDVAFQNMIFKELNPILKEVFNKIV